VSRPLARFFLRRSVFSFSFSFLLPLFVGPLIRSSGNAPRTSPFFFSTTSLPPLSALVRSDVRPPRKRTNNFSIRFLPGSPPLCRGSGAPFALLFRSSDKWLLSSLFSDEESFPTPRTLQPGFCFFFLQSFPPPPLLQFFSPFSRLRCFAPVIASFPPPL